MASEAAQLQLQLLGPPEVRLGEKPLIFPTRKTLALLIYLALEAGPQPREHLAALLWPESSPERSHASLRNTLGHLQTALRQASGQSQTPYLLVTHTTLALNLGTNLHLDLQIVEQAYTQARADRSKRTPALGSASVPLLQAAAASHRGEFLAGFSLGDASAFDDWVDIQRELWRRRLGLILDRLSEIQFALGELASTAEISSLWIALDPLNEVAYRRKMRAHFAAGERGQALEAYEACRAALKAELNLDPEPDTVALATLIRTQQNLQHALPLPQRFNTPVSFLENLFAGRAAENQVLVERFQRATGGQPQVVILRGDAGIGKTRLAGEFLQWAVRQGAETLHGRGFESSSRMSYQPLIDAIRPMLGQDHVVQGWLDKAWLDPLSQLFPELSIGFLQLPLPQSVAPAGRTQLFESVVHLTLALANRAPLVLFLDDMQWTDSATLDLLQYAIRRWQESAAPILLLIGLRPEALQPPFQPRHANLPAWLAHVERILTPTHLSLKPLGERDAIQMVLSILKPPAVDFAQWVFNETQGQPFYLIETLKDLLERGALHPKRQAEDKWAFEVDAEHDLGQAIRVPSTVLAVIRSRLNRLSPTALAMLAAGSTLEQHLTFERLCVIANLTEDAGLPALDELVSGQLVLEVARPGTASTYIFAHHMIWDVVYTEAGDARRRLFHKRALSLLEAAHEPAAVLAHHALAAGLTPNAFQHSLVAGEEALRVQAVREAIVHLEQARQLAREASLSGPAFEPQLHALYQQLGLAYELDGQPAKAQALRQETKP